MHHAQQMQVVVAEHAAGVEIAQQAQDAGGVGATVDEVANGVQLVAGGVEGELLEQAFELLTTALDIADEDAAGHSSSLPPSSVLRDSSSRPASLARSGPCQRL